MEKLDTGKEKIQKICSILRKETIEPAKQEAKEILENASLEREQIIKQAQIEAQNIIDNGKKENEKFKKIFESSINLACQKVIDDLKEKIENVLFNENLKNLLDKELENPKIISEIIKVIILAIEEEGIDSDISAFIGKKISAKDVDFVLLDKIKEKLKENKVKIADFDTGVYIKLIQEQITIDMSDLAIREMVASFIQEEFRKMIFS